MLWKVVQNVMISIIFENRAGKLNISTSQKESKKIQGKMNSKLRKLKKFKQKEDKNLWKNYVVNISLLPLSDSTFSYISLRQ